MHKQLYLTETGNFSGVVRKGLKCRNMMIRNGEHSLLSNDPILNGLKSAFAIEDLLIVLPDIFVLTVSP
jgi:hypothetical protein